MDNVHNVRIMWIVCVGSERCEGGANNNDFICVDPIKELEWETDGRN